VIGAIIGIPMIIGLFLVSAWCHIKGAIRAADDRPYDYPFQIRRTPGCGVAGGPDGRDLLCGGAAAAPADHQLVGSQGCAIDQQLSAGADRLPL
jgi:hypothetical protein